MLLWDQHAPRTKMAMSLWKMNSGSSWRSRKNERNVSSVRTKQSLCYCFHVDTCVSVKAARVSSCNSISTNAIAHFADKWFYKPWMCISNRLFEKAWTLVRLLCVADIFLKHSIIFHWSNHRSARQSQIQISMQILSRRWHNTDVHFSSMIKPSTAVKECCIKNYLLRGNRNKTGCFP